MLFLRINKALYLIVKLRTSYLNPYMVSSTYCKGSTTIMIPSTFTRFPTAYQLPPPPPPKPPPEEPPPELPLLEGELTILDLVLAMAWEKDLEN